MQVSATFCSNGLHSYLLKKRIRIEILYYSASDIIRNKVGCFINSENLQACVMVYCISTLLWDLKSYEIPACKNRDIKYSVVLGIKFFWKSSNMQGSACDSCTANIF